MAEENKQVKTNNPQSGVKQSTTTPSRDFFFSKDTIGRIRAVMLPKLNEGQIYYGDLCELLSREDPDLEMAYIFINYVPERKNVPWHDQGLKAYQNLYKGIYQKCLGDKTVLSLNSL